MAAAPPPPPPDGPDDEDPAKEEELFALFRHLRERVFVGSSEIVSHVMRGIEAQIQTAPRESFAATVLVQLTNWITSWVDPDARDGDDADGTKEPNEEARPETPAGDEGPSPGDDDE
jgi:hypothetical protein